MWYDPTAWQQHLVSGAERIIGGAVSIAGASRIDASGNVQVAETMIANSADEDVRRSFEVYVADGGFSLLPELPIVQPVIIRQGGITYRQSAVLKRREVHRSAYYQKYVGKHRIEDALSTVQLAADGLVFGISVMRCRGDISFTSRDEGALALITVLVAERLDRTLETRESFGRRSLSPRLREMLDALLDGLSEKEAADRLSISPYTAHEYITALYRRFGVHSRSDLMACFIRAHRGLHPPP
jgi:DNA-binding NarL/FixJ family response regulator